MIRTLPTAGILMVALTTASACTHSATDRSPSPDLAHGPQIDSSKISGVPAARVEDHLAGRFPGVRITRLANGGISVRVWGPTLHSNQEPLYVVDGQPIRTTPGRGLYWLNPEDIATIRVLKDVSETAAWGVRGGNGVVVITTKRGHDGG